MGVSVRAMTPRDVLPLAALESAHREHIGRYMREPVRGAAELVTALVHMVAADERGVAWHGVVELDGEIVGLAAVVPLPVRQEDVAHPDSPRAGDADDVAGEWEYIGWTAPPALRRGAGRAGLQASAEAAAGLGAVRLVARVRSDNAAMRALVSSAGFVDDGPCDPAATGPTAWWRYVLRVGA